MIAVQRQPFTILLFIYLFFFSFRFCISQHSGNRNVGGNSIAGVPTLWINRPDYEYPHFTSILGGNGNSRFLFGFSCNIDSTNFFVGVIMIEELVWSANRNHPVETNATLELGQDGNLVLADSDGTLVWSTNTTGKSVSGLNLTEKGNLVLFDKANRTIWQSFDHPTDSLLPGQRLVSGRKLTASVSAFNMSQGLLSLTVLNGGVGTYIDSDPPQFYYTSKYPYDNYYSFDSHTLTAFPDIDTSAQFMKLESDGHLRVYIWNVNRSKWNDPLEMWSPFVGKCGYPVEDIAYVQMMGNVSVQLKVTSSGHLLVGTQILDVRS